VGPILRKIFGQTDAVVSESTISDLSAPSASAITRSEKVQSCLIESPLRAFQWA